jgi:putative ABC transport system ATP-binding protein
MISLRGIAKRHRDGEREQVVLDSLDLEVAAGEMVAVVGASGSGKSTLLYIAGGLDADFGGEAVVAGQSLRGMDERTRATFRNRSVGFVFQSFNLLSSLTALNNVMLPALLRGEAPEAARTHAAACLAQVGLSGKEGSRPVRLSGGERQRVAIARALFSKPKVLLADEPTGNLDAVSGAAVIELFQQLHRTGVTVLVVTHEERVSRTAGRVLRLESGKLRS